MAPAEGFSKCSCQHCGGHIEYPATGTGRSIQCPHCNQRTLLKPDELKQVAGNVYDKGSRYPLIIASALLVVITAALLFFLLGNRHQAGTEAGATRTNSIPTNAAPLVVAPEPPPDLWKGLMAGPVKLEKSNTGSLVYAVGSLSNSTDHERFGVKVELVIFNSAREKVGTATDYTPTIEPGKLWKFKALVTDRSATSAELSTVKEN